MTAPWYAPLAVALVALAAWVGRRFEDDAVPVEEEEEE